MKAIDLKESDLEITHVRGSGPGGQHRNKRFTGVRMRHLPTGLEVLCTEERSQAQNLDAAYRRLAEKISRHFHKPKPRRRTKKSRGSIERRLDNKRLASKTKKMRSERF